MTNITATAMRLLILFVWFIFLIKLLHALTVCIVDWLLLLLGGGYLGLLSSLETGGGLLILFFVFGVHFVFFEGVLIGGH